MWYAPLIGGLLQAMGSFVGQALISASIGVIAFKLMDVSVAWAKDHFFTAAGGLPPVTLQALGLMQIDASVEMLISAIIIRLVFKGMQAGVMKSFKVK
jgi:hypothetical protein